MSLRVLRYGWSCLPGQRQPQSIDITSPLPVRGVADDTEERWVGHIVGWCPIFHIGAHGIEIIIQELDQGRVVMIRQRREVGHDILGIILHGHIRERLGIIVDAGHLDGLQHRTMTVDSTGSLDVLRNGGTLSTHHANHIQRHEDSDPGPHPGPCDPGGQERAALLHFFTPSKLQDSEVQPSTQSQQSELIFRATIIIPNRGIYYVAVDLK
jgi:hypothetical protein